MSYATILAPVEGGRGSESVVRTALSVGRTFDAYVEILHVEVDPTSALIAPGDGISGAAAEQIMEGVRAAAEERSKAARQLFDEHCVAAGLRVVEEGSQGEPGRFAVGWRRIVGDQMDEVARRARLFDLTVLAQPDPEAGGVNAATFETALFHSGRPVLVAPQAAPKGGWGKNVAVAWNGSREAVHAIGAALPFIVRADTVTVITIREEDEALGAEQLSGYFARHGVGVTPRNLPHDHRPDAEVLLASAADAGSDLLVMGGYGHSRLRELVLGGATRGVLNEARIPVFMAH